LREPQKELIGAYFCHEYSYAAAALMNPSIVPHFDQSGLQPGSQRFILSLRAVGEGHISSIAFREGIVAADGGLTLMPQPPFAVAVDGVDPDRTASGEVIAHRRDAVSLSGAVIFPFTPAQRNGLEDLRLVRFAEADGSIVYYGTYTAYSGAAIASELLITQDFRTFTLRPMAGAATASKGMALFPRRIDGGYAMIGRQDNESLYLMRSNDLVRWDGGDLLMTPVHPWELVQIGNCGSPIEIDEGWLLLTHGVGAMRQYSIGAALLDKHDPRRVLARTAKPLLSPIDENREGYVPNVVYTCGALLNGRTLFMPYGVADSTVAFCTIDVDELLAEMG
ncbi:MAG: glycoside hydrolase family 130 protein, partial [Hyphomonadaceae bacterium]